MSEKSLTTFYNFLLLVCAMLERNEENSHRKKIEKKKEKRKIQKFAPRFLVYVNLD